MAVVKVKDEVKELREVYMNTKNSDSYKKWLCNRVSNVVKFSNGYLLEFEKQDIKKSFCFGHGFCGISTEEESNNAHAMSEHARTNTNYFIQENLEYYNNLLKDYAEIVDLMEQGYNESNVGILCFKNSNYSNVCFIRPYTSSYDKERQLRMYSNCEELGVLTKEDIENMIEVIEEEKVKFTKRLNTYLKRYGLSKVRSWTYLVD